MRVTRAFDLVMCVLILPFALAVAALIALAVVLDSRGPVFYRALRVGTGGRTFRMLKFRKMREGADGPPLTCRHDERLTRVGRFLSASKLDELPQLWHVLTGEMRLVGPRPEVPEFVDCHREEYEEIVSMPPGLTGITQLRFFQESHMLADKGQAVVTYRDHLLPRKVALDLWYVRNRSVARDLALLVQTTVLPLRLLLTFRSRRRRTAAVAARGEQPVVLPRRAITREVDL